jgi:hypothetical protein
MAQLNDLLLDIYYETNVMGRYGRGRLFGWLGVIEGILNFKTEKPRN